MLAEHVGSRLHICHVSTAGSVEIIRWAKATGIDVTAEVTPHHLLLTDDLRRDLRPGLQGQPAAAPDEDVEALRAALADGTIDAVATDHAPHAGEDKDRELADAAFGMLGLETALPVVARPWSGPACSTGPASPTAMSVRPARIAGWPATAGRWRSASRPT